MRARPVVSSLGSIASLASFAYLPAAVVAWFTEPRTFDAFGVLVPHNTLLFAGLFLGVLVGGQALRFSAGRPSDLRDIEGYAVVSMAWLLVSLLFTLPFILGRAVPTWPDALFEGMSGITTTGFSVIADVDALAPSFVFWRSWIQWVGGGGIAVLSVAVLARLTESGARLMRAELPGGSVTRLKPKIAQTAKSLYSVYLTMTIIVFGVIFAALLFAERLPWKSALWEGVNLAFTAYATGGFSPHTAGMAFYESAWVRHALVFGMIAGGTSLTLIWFAAHGDLRRLFRDLEWRTFLFLVFGGTLVVTAILVATPEEVWTRHTEAWTALGQAQGVERESVWAAFTAALFNVTSLVTTAGFGFPDYDAWPEAARIVLLLVMFTGACAGSTAGALKLARVILLTKVARREILKLVNPNAYVPVRIGSAVVSEDAIRGVIAFFFAYLGIFIASTIFVALFGHDFFTAASVSAGAIGNVGIGLGTAGPCCTLSEWHPVVKVWLSFVMWVGRLEIFAALLLFFPSTYQR